MNETSHEAKTDLGEAQDSYYAAGGMPSQSLVPRKAEWFWRRAAKLWRDASTQKRRPLAEGISKPSVAAVANLESLVKSMESETSGAVLHAVRSSPETKQLMKLLEAYQLSKPDYREVLRGIAKKIVQTVDDSEEIPEDVVGTIEESGACTEAETAAWAAEVDA